MLGVAKMFGMKPQEALYDISYKNAIMYSRAMPMPDDGEDEDGATYFDESLDANNPDNFSKFDNFDGDEISVRI